MFCLFFLRPRHQARGLPCQRAISQKAMQAIGDQDLTKDGSIALCIWQSWWKWAKQMKPGHMSRLGSNALQWPLNVSKDICIFSNEMGTTTALGLIKWSTQLFAISTAHSALSTAFKTLSTAPSAFSLAFSLFSKMSFSQHTVLLLQCNQTLFYSTQCFYQIASPCVQHVL